MRNRILAVLGAAALMAPQVARADAGFANCSLSLTVCAGSSVALTNGGSTIVVKVWNQGGNTFSRLSSIGLFNLGVGGTFASASFHQADGTVSDIGSFWANGAINGFLSGAGSPGSLDVAAKVSHNGDGIATCTGPFSAGANTRWVTCPGGPGATEGYVAFTFNLDNSLASLPSDLQWGFRAQSIGPQGLSEKCFSSGDQNCIPSTTTPEPISMVLLATGLAGMGGTNVLRRRRKRQQPSA